MWIQSIEKEEKRKKNKINKNIEGNEYKIKGKEWYFSKLK